MSSSFQERLRIALRMGEAFRNLMRSVENEAFIIQGADRLQEIIEEYGGAKNLPHNTMVFENSVSWMQQGIWFSSVSFAETMRIRFLTHGIDLVEDPDSDDGKFFILKDPSKEVE